MRNINDKMVTLDRTDIIRFIRVKDVKKPYYGTEGSVGIDFFAPNDMEPITLKPQEDAMIPSGLKMEIPVGTALIAFNKSGVATKKKFGKGAQVIDWDYQGEIHIHVFNHGKEDRTIQPGDKLMQFILLPVIKATLIEYDDENKLFPVETERGERGFGEGTGNN